MPNMKSEDSRVNTASASREMKTFVCKCNEISIFNLNLVFFSFLKIKKNLSLNTATTATINS